MKKFKNTFITGVLLVTIVGLSTPVFASTREDVLEIQETITLRDVNLIEDNGESYVEIIISENQITSMASARASSSGTYTTTYDMTGGVFTQQTWNCTKAPTFIVKIIPETFAGEVSGNMSIHLEMKPGLSWGSVDTDSVSLVDGGKVTLKGSKAGNYRLYFRNWTGHRATGEIEISYSY